MDFPAAFDFEGETDKFLARMKKGASKNFKVTVARSLENAMHLAYWSHVFGRDEEALEVCEFLALIPFPGNYNLWTWLEGSLALYARLLRQNNPESELARACVRRIHDAGFEKRRLSGLFIDGEPEKAEAASREGNKVLERELRAALMTELCIVTELGGSPELPMERAETMYQENLGHLRALMGATAEPAPR